MIDHVEQCVSAVKTRNFTKFRRHIKQAPTFTFMLSTIPLHEDSVNQEFLMLLSLRDHFDINASREGAVNVLQKAMRLGKIAHAHLLIQAGADINVRYGGDDLYREARFCAYTGHPGLKSHTTAIMLQSMLLSIGLVPRENSRILVEVQKMAQNWIQSLHAAKSAFEMLFDNPTLEEELIEFIYNEEALLAVLS